MPVPERRPGAGLDANEVRAELREALPSEWRTKVLEETSEPRRYNLLARPLLEAVADDPAGTLRRRVAAAGYFAFGQEWFGESPGRTAPGQESSAGGVLPGWVSPPLVK